VILKFKRLNPDLDRTLVALSGGVDSVALLYCLSRIKDLEIIAAQITYDIRSKEETDEDRRCAKTAAEKCEVDYLNRFCSVVKESKERGENLESFARDERYRAFNSILNIRLVSSPGKNFIKQEINGYKCKAFIATAHHADDQLETMIMFLARGAGLAGLSGINEKSRVPCSSHTTLRPMLCITHADAIAICKAAGLEWAEDSTNLDTDLTRNKIRHQIVPILKEINPKASQNFSNAADIIRSAHETVENALAYSVRTDYDCMAPGWSESVNTDSMRLVPDVVIYEWLGQTARSLHGYDGMDKISKRMLDAVVDAIRNRKTVKFDWPLRTVEVGPERVTMTKASKNKTEDFEEKK